MPGGRRGDRLAGAVLFSGGVLAAGLVLVVALAAALLVPFGAWRPATATVLVAAALPGLWWVSRRLPSRPVPVWTAAAVGLAAVGHGVWAAVTHSEDVGLGRDPGAYTLIAQWIAGHHGLPIDVAVSAFGGASALADPSFSLDSAGFFQVVHGNGAHVAVSLVPQFFPGAPAVYSLGWWVGGWTGLFTTPAVVGALAVLAAAGLAARLVGPRTAVLAAVVLAVCEPVVHVARGTYSEPVALLLAMAAASLLVDATVAGQPRSARQLGFLAGVFIGLSGLVRVDVLEWIVLVLPLAALLALRRHPAAGPLAAGALVGGAVSAVQAAVLSLPYLEILGGSIRPLLAVGVLVGYLSVAVVVVSRKRSSRRVAAGVEPTAPTPAAVQRWSRAAALAVLLVGVALATRPWWWVSRGSTQAVVAEDVGSLQRQQGLPFDPGRLYSEYSVEWVVWYLGLAAVVLAWVVLAVLASRAVRWWFDSRPAMAVGAQGRYPTPGWLAPALLGLVIAVRTLLRPGVTPDHPWADRRLVPVVLPLVVLASCAAVAWAVRWTRRRWRSRTATASVAVAGAALLLLPAVQATWPLADARTGRGQLAGVESVCRSLGSGDTVLVVGGQPGWSRWPQTIHSICGVPAAVVQPKGGDLAADVRRAAQRVSSAGRRPVVLVTVDPQTVPSLDVRTWSHVTFQTSVDQNLLTRRPDGVRPATWSVYVGPWSS
jgi:hypothetical protein